MDAADSEHRWVWLIWGVGGSLGLILLAEIGLLLGQDYPRPDAYTAGALTSAVVIAGLLYGGYWIATSDLPPERYRRIALSFLAGGAGFLLLNVIIMVSVPPDTLLYAVSWARWAVSLGGGAGLLIGIFEARAIDRARAAERLRVKQQEVSRQNELLEEFASVVSHDLRNPLSVAKGRVELAREEEDLDHLESAQRALDRMETIVEDTLQMAREGQRVGVLQPTDLGPLVDSCWAIVDTGDADLVVEALPTIRADPDRLRHVFENLFRNAVEHGGDDVTVRVGPLAEADGFFVEDDGPGIPADEVSAVFESRYTTSGQGSGFGLSIVQRVVRGHGWEISVTESDDGGARFEVTGVEVVDEAER